MFCKSFTKHLFLELKAGVDQMVVIYSYNLSANKYFIWFQGRKQKIRGDRGELLQEY